MASDEGRSFRFSISPMLYEMLNDYERITGETASTLVTSLIESYFSDEESENLFSGDVDA